MLQKVLLTEGFVMKKRILSIVVAFVMVLGLMPVMPSGVKGDSIGKYIDANGVPQDIPEAGETVKVINAENAAEYDSDIEQNYSYGTIIVSGTVRLNNRIYVKCDNTDNTEPANNVLDIILLDGCDLTLSKGINVSQEATLNIFVGSTTGTVLGTGKLTATGGTHYAGIGGAGQGIGNAGNITINGGIITATGGHNAAGIGGGFGDGYFAGGTVIINNGIVTANGGIDGAGIGGGAGGAGGSVTINGGIVVATGGTNAEGIGKGNNGSNSGSLTLNNDTKLCTSGGGNSWSDPTDSTSSRTQYMIAGKNCHIVNPED